VSDQQSLLSETLRRILKGNNDRDAGTAVAEWSSSSWQELENAGMTGIGIDESLGGSGGSFEDQVTTVFEIGRHASLQPLPETIMLAGWLREIASWPWSGGAETVGVGHPSNIVARRNGSELLLHGTIRGVPWARVAKKLLVVVESEGSTLLAELEPESFDIEPHENQAGEPRDTVVLESVRLRADQWMPVAITSQDLELRSAFMRSVSATGCLSAIVEMTSTYAHDREQFGRPLDKFQAVQQLLARLAAEYYASTICVRNAVFATREGSASIGTMSAVVRLAQASSKGARIAHQIHGAIGITEEYPLHHFTTRLWCWRNEFGGEARWSRELATFVRDSGGGEQLWPLITNTLRETK
jgi:acyl-CoA dehydrogenase